MQLVKFSEQDKKDYGKSLIVAQHFLNETGLFTDEALIKLLDNHPNHLIDFQHLPADAEYIDKHITVDFTGADGAMMLKAAKSSGRVWINVREAMSRLPEYREVLEQVHSEMEKYTGSNADRRNSRGGILISSPSAATPYHADPTITHLWHIRGHKKAWVYPRGQNFMPDEAYEAIVLGEVNEDMPFNYEMDKGAIVSPADLHGGELVAWPHRSPHRVENVTFCVSMVMEFSTRKSAFTNAGMMANGILRRRYGRNPSWANASKPEKLAKAIMGRAMYKAGMRKKHYRTDMVEYKFDANAKGFVSPVETPYERVH